jgi:hypothetical protein
MARRNPKPGAAAHIAHSSVGTPAEETESVWQWFKRQEWDIPEKRVGNITIVTSLSLFFGSIVAFRVFGDALAPA